MKKNEVDEETAFTARKLGLTVEQFEAKMANELKPATHAEKELARLKEAFEKWNDKRDSGDSWQDSWGKVCSHRGSWRVMRFLQRFKWYRKRIGGRWIRNKYRKDWDMEFRKYWGRKLDCSWCQDNNPYEVGSARYDIEDYG